MEVHNGLLEGLGQLIVLLVGGVLLALVQQTDDMGHLGVLVHVERQVIQRGDGLTRPVGGVVSGQHKHRTNY